MPYTARRQLEKEQMRQSIIQAANAIADDEGILNVSIRKIARKIDYAPATIYLYFPDKTAIISAIIQLKYANLLNAMDIDFLPHTPPIEKIAQLTQRYIDTALLMQEEYLSIMLDSSPGILEHTSVLGINAYQDRKALAILFEALKEFYRGMLDDATIARKCQVIWAASFGLIARLIIEKSPDINYQKLLIKEHIQFVVASLESDFKK